MAAKDNLNSQRKTFTAASAKLAQLEGNRWYNQIHTQRGLTLSPCVVATFPGIGKLIGEIQHKKVKDNIVLSFVIAGCICMLLWLFVL